MFQFLLFLTCDMSKMVDLKMCIKFVTETKSCIKIHLQFTKVRNKFPTNKFVVKSQPMLLT